VKHLLELDSIIDLNSKDDTYGRSAISWAAGNGFDVVVELLTKGINRRLKGIKLPFRKKAQVDSVDRYDRTPLVYAVLNGHVAVVKRLLKAGARIDVADDIGGTALSYAVCSGLLTLLFRKGIKAGPEDETRVALLVSAVEKGHEAVVKLLLETGKIDLELKDGNGRTPLSCAVERGSVAIVQLLLAEGAKTGVALLTSAVEKGHEADVKLLLKTGKIDLELKDGDGRTPLSCAVERWSETVVQLLLTEGVKTDYKYKIVSRFNHIPTGQY
jgi:ankyrin repeat protein